MTRLLIPFLVSMVWACAPLAPVDDGAGEGEGERHPGEGEGEGQAGEGEGEGEGEGQAGASPVRLNEVSCSGDWIELTNPGAAAAGALFLTDDVTDPSRRQVVGTDPFAPGAFVVVDVAAFGVGCGQDTLTLLDAAGAVVDSVLVGVPGAGLTWGRLPDGTGAFAATKDTRGQPNAPPATSPVRINEVSCHGREWIELIDTGGAGLDVTGFAVGTRVDGAGSYLLPALIIPPSGRVVVDQADPAGPTVGYPFGIQCGVEGVALFDAAGVLVDTAPPALPPPGGASGRLPDGTGAFAATEPTRGGANRAFVDGRALVFDPGVVAAIDLTIAQADLDAVAADASVYVPAGFTFTGADQVADGPLVVDVRLKGRLGSFRTLDGKAGLKVDLNREVPGQGFHGIEKLALNNMVQDDSAIHEHLAYAIFRAAGVPAPQLGYAWVRINGVPYGLYATVETQDDPWLRLHYASTLHLYEGSYGDDLQTASVANFDLDEGVDFDRADLATLVAAVEAAPQVGFMAALAPRVDWDEVLTTMAVEVFIGHWDGYAPTRNNFFLHFDAAGVATLLPWGTDQTFQLPLGIYDGYGVLLQRCLADRPCRARYEAAMVRVVDAVAALDYAGDTAALSARLQPFADADPRLEWSAANLGAAGDAAVAFLDERVVTVRAELACTTDPLADTDGDGSSCSLDCDEADPGTHAGAADVCGDDVDQDCNGRPDDAPDCPDCHPVAHLGRAYSFCFNARTFADAEAACEALGQQLVSIDDADELAFVQATAQARLNQTFWLGLDDLTVEGEFVRLDGTPPVFTNWNAGEPNDYFGAEDCGTMDAGGGLWNDLGCGSTIASVCEQVP